MQQGKESSSLQADEWFLPRAGHLEMTGSFLLNPHEVPHQQVLKYFQDDRSRNFGFWMCPLKGTHLFGYVADHTIL